MLDSEIYPLINISKPLDKTVPPNMRKMKVIALKE